MFRGSTRLAGIDQDQLNGSSPGLADGRCHRNMEVGKPKQKRQCLRFWTFLHLWVIWTINHVPKMSFRDLRSKLMQIVLIHNSKILRIIIKLFHVFALFRFHGNNESSWLSTTHFIVEFSCTEFSSRCRNIDMAGTEDRTGCWCSNGPLEWTRSCCPYSASRRIHGNFFNIYAIWIIATISRQSFQHLVSTAMQKYQILISLSFNIYFFSPCINLFEIRFGWKIALKSIRSHVGTASEIWFLFFGSTSILL